MTEDIQGTAALQDMMTEGLRGRTDMPGIQTGVTVITMTEEVQAVHTAVRAMQAEALAAMQAAVHQGTAAMPTGMTGLIMMTEEAAAATASRQTAAAVRGVLTAIKRAAGEPESRRRENISSCS